MCVPPVRVTDPEQKAFGLETCLLKLVMWAEPGLLCFCRNVRQFLCMVTSGSFIDLKPAWMRGVERKKMRDGR